MSIFVCHVKFFLAGASLFARCWDCELYIEVEAMFPVISRFMIELEKQNLYENTHYKVAKCQMYGANNVLQKIRHGRDHYKVLLFSPLIGWDLN